MGAVGLLLPRFRALAGHLPDRAADRDVSRQRERCVEKDNPRRETGHASVAASAYAGFVYRASVVEYPSMKKAGLGETLGPDHYFVRAGRQHELHSTLLVEP